MTKLRVLALLSAVALAGCGGSGGTFVLVKIEQGTAPAGVKSVDLQLALAGQMTTVTLAKAGGADIGFPTGKTLEIGSASGTLSVTALAKDAGGAVLARGSASGVVVRGETTTITVRFGTDMSVDGGVPDGGPDAQVTAPILTADSTAHDFGTVVMGTSSGTATFTITNTGTAASGTLSATLGGANSGEYVIVTDMCGGHALAVGASCTVTVKLTPTALGSLAATLTIAGSPGGSLVINLTGTSVAPGALSITPMTHSFGSAAIGSTGTPFDFIVKNTGGTALTAVPVVALSGTDAGDFAITTNGCTTALGPGAMCTVSVGFSPASVGNKQASLSAMGGGTTVAQLSATATATLIVMPAGNGSGVVTSAPTGINCGATCSFTFSSPTVTLTANPGLGNSFVGFSGGGCTGTAPCTVGLDAASKTVTATFSLMQFPVTASTAGTGTGTVSGAGLNCTSSCSANFNYGQMIAIVATPDATANFGSWSGCTTTSGTTCNVTVDAAKMVTATFNVKTFTVALTKAGTAGLGDGTVTSVPGGITCGTTCSASFPVTGNAVLTAVPDGVSIFTSWTGCTSTSGATCTVSSAVPATKAVTATFAMKPNCTAANAGVIHYVDHVNGTDDTMHGGGSGICAYKTLTYALTQATGQISLAAETYPGTVPTDATPYLLTGTQQLVCNNSTLASPNGYMGIVSFNGTRNGLTNCRLDGGGAGGYCLVVNSSGAAAGAGNFMTGSTMTGCGNVAVHIGSGVNNLAFTSNNFQANWLVLDWVGSNTGGTMTNNTFTANGSLDIYCEGTAPTDPGVTGSGNSHNASKCVGCANCPF